MINLAEYTSKFRAKLIIAIYRRYLKQKERVLDVGCGNGVVSTLLAKRLQIDITGCDVMNYLSVPMEFVMMKKNDKLPFPPKTFDSSFFNDVLHHTSKPNQIKLIKEALRVSKKVLIFEVLPTSAGKIADFVINKIHNPKMNISFTFRTRKEWRKVFEKLGVSYRTVSVKRPFLYPFSHIAFVVNS